MAHNDFTVHELYVKAGIPKAMNALRNLFTLMKKSEDIPPIDALNDVVYYNLVNSIEQFKKIVLNELSKKDKEL